MKDFNCFLIGLFIFFFSSLIAFSQTHQTNLQLNNTDILYFKSEALFKCSIKLPDNYDQVKHADALKDWDILLLGSWKDQQIVLEEHILPLYRKLQELNAEKLQIQIFNTDHWFVNAKGALVETLTKWIKDK